MIDFMQHKNGDSTWPKLTLGGFPDTVSALDEKKWPASQWLGLPRYFNRICRGGNSIQGITFEFPIL